MKKIKFLTIALFFIGAISSVNAKVLTEIPVKTAVIKAAGAENADLFFSTTKVVAIHVFKAGTTEDLNTLVTKLKENSSVEQVILGKTTGDYTNINITLKEVKNKSFWMELFKSAGMDHVKINNKEAVETGKL
jgi:exopolysaccharide biosynthesis protein